MGTWSLALITASGPFFFIVMSTVATLIAPDYSSLSDNMSKLAGPGIPYPWVFQGAVLGYALLIQPLGLVLYQSSGGGLRGALLWALVLVYSVGGIMAAVFRHGHSDPVIGTIAESAIHDFAARLSFLGLYLLIIVTPWVLRQHRERYKWGWFSLLVVLLTTFLVVLFEVKMWPSYLGLIQRFLFCITMAWIFVTALLLRSRIPSNV